MSTTDRRRYRTALLYACAAMFLAGGAAAQQSPPASTSGPATNLGTLVVAPDNAPEGATATKGVRIQRSPLKLNIATGPGGGGSSSSTPRSGPASTPEPVKRTPPRPLHVVPPQYPARALSHGTKGSVTVAFQVNRHGRTTHIRIVKSTPPGIFNKAARRAVRQWRFQPATRNDKAVAKNVTQTINFNPPAGSGAQHKAPAPPEPRPKAGHLPADHVPSNVHALHIMAPSYPRNAYRSDQGGRVTVQFVVKPNGHTARIRVLASRPRGVFDRAAIKAVRQWRFKPIANPAVVVQTITFTPPDQR